MHRIYIIYIYILLYSYIYLKYYLSNFIFPSINCLRVVFVHNFIAYFFILHTHTHTHIYIYIYLLFIFIYIYLYIVSLSEADRTFTAAPCDYFSKDHIKASALLDIFFIAPVSRLGRSYFCILFLDIIVNIICLRIVFCAIYSILFDES